MDGAVSEPAPALLRDLACAAARVAGQIALDGFGGDIRVDYKADRSEVTEFDRAAEAAVIEFLRAHRPGDGFLGEELGYRAGGGGTGARPTVTWVVDPIDGTRNFSRGMPMFACSVGALVDGVPVAGAVYHPTRDEMYSAATGVGAWLGESRLPALPCDPPGAGRGSLVVAIPSHHTAATDARVRAIVERRVVRSLGCTTLHMAMVAAGRFDAALMNNCKLWDIAAGWVIVGEAGGVATDLSGGSHFPLGVDAYASQSLPTLVGSPYAHGVVSRE
jgi:myo-inositol-1(or 4)-monophosphatase